MGLAWDHNAQQVILLCQIQRLAVFLMNGVQLLAGERIRQLDIEAADMLLFRQRNKAGDVNFIAHLR